MEVITLLLLVGTCLVECQAKSSEDDHTSPLPVSSLVVAVGTLIIIYYMLIKDVQTLESNVQVAAEDPQDILKVQKAMSALRGSLENFSSELMKTRENTEIFSLSVSALYDESTAGLPLQNLHEDTKRDALLYINGILPLHSVVMRSIEKFFNQYVSRDFDEWRQHLSVMLNDVRGYRQCCQFLLKLYIKIMVQVKRRHDQAKELEAELENTNTEKKQKKRELEKLAAEKKQMALLFLMAPWMFKICSVVAYVSAKNDEKKAEEEGQETEINISALAMVNKTMIPFLDAFTDSLDAVAGSFKVIEEDILCFKDKNEKVIELHQQMHYKLMKSQAIEIKENCTAFLAMIRKVRCVFDTLPQTSFDRLYVTEWLNRELAIITFNYPEKITGQLRNMLSHFKAATPEHSAI